VGQVNGFGTILVSKGPLTAAAATAWLTLRLIVYASGTGYAAVIARDTGATLWRAASPASQT
jgi:hypothetical protein